MSKDYPSVPNKMDLELPSVYGNVEETEKNTRLQHLSLDLKTFVSYLRDMQESLPSKQLTLGPSTRWVWLFKTFVRIQLDGWLQDTVGVGKEAIRIGGLFYGLPKDLNAFWGRIEGLQEDTPLNDILARFLPEPPNSGM